jgi:Right handed beta helix region
MSAQSVTEPIPQFHNRDGQPLDGGFIYVGQAGLDAQANQIQLYLDPALTVPLAQPVQTLNGYPSNGGTPVAFYAAVGDFSIKLLDAQGLLVLSAPNVTTRLDASNLTGSISSALVSFLQFGAGAVSRTVQDKLRDTVSVFDFMTAAQVAAVKAGTFLVDVTVPINAAISSGAREVFFPQGGYAISAPINIGATSTGVSLVGAGRQSTVIRNTGAGTPAVQSIGNAILNNTSIRIADMSIEGQAGTGQGVLLDYTSQAVLERLDCYTNGLSGIKVLHGSHIAINDCWSRSNIGNAIEIGPEAFFVDVKGGTFETSANGLVVDSGGGTPARHITITGAAFRSANTLNAYLTDGATDVRFLGCDFTAAGGTTGVHLSADGLIGATVSGVLVEGCTFVGNNGTTSIIGIYARECTDVSIVASVIDCTGSTAYDIDVTALRTRIVNNMVIAGATVDASGTTSQVLPDGGQYLIRRNVAYTGPTTIDMGAGEVRMNSALIAQLFRFYALSAVGLLAIQRWDDKRVWFSPLDGRMYVKDVTDPTFTSDGELVNSGVTTSYARGSLPTPGALTLGRMIKGTGYAAGAAWGALEAGIAAGADAYLFVGIAGGWRVFAQAS